MKVSFLVRPDLARWGCDHGSFESGSRHEIANAKAGFVEQIASAAAFGSLVDVVYDAAAAKIAGKAVQSQADGEKALAKAMADGRWQEGNLAQYELAQAALSSGEAGLETGGES